MSEYTGPPPTLAQMADAIHDLVVWHESEHPSGQQRTRHFASEASRLLKMLDGMLPECPRCHGTKRVIDYRATAVRDVDYRTGYSIEFSPDQAMTSADYDDLEEALRSGEKKPLTFNWRVTSGQDWETMPCSCRTGKLPLFDAVGMAGELIAPVVGEIS